MKQFIYADNAATTVLDPGAFEAMKPYLLNEYGNASQPYSFSRAAKKALKEARETIADCIGAKPEEIFFTSGGTESDNWAIKGTAFADADKGATITSAIEHHAVLRSCEVIERLGYPVAYLQPDRSGVISADALSDIITGNTRLVSVMLANNEIGTIEPIRELSDVAHSHGAAFHTDAVQAVGHIPVNVDELGVDMLSASAHKFNGPKGVGFLYIRRGTRISPYQNGGSQENDMRAGTENVAGIVGMAAALERNCSDLDAYGLRMKELERILTDRLNAAGIDYIRNGGAYRLPGNLSLSFRDSDGEMLLHRLDLMGISISTGSACDSVNTQVSHVIKAIKVPDGYAKGTIRISFGKYNTENDALAIADRITKIFTI
ncbi:MAG: cysteine desulfurase [Clostridia bacterium]|nr:cysteine desulfurase [Clostridia bacterium]